MRDAMTRGLCGDAVSSRLGLGLASFFAAWPVLQYDGFLDHIAAGS